MSDTTLISLRVPNSLLAVIDAWAKQENRSRAKMILMMLTGDRLNRPEPEPSADGTLKRTGALGASDASAATVRRGRLATPTTKTKLAGKIVDGGDSPAVSKMPFTGSGMCPHHFASRFSCPECNPRIGR